MRILTVTIVVVGAAGLGAWFFWPRDTAVRRLTTFQDAIRSSDWEALYDQAHPTDLQAQGISKDQFVKLMQSVSSHINASDLRDLEVSTVPGATQTSAAHLVKFPRLKSAGLSIHAMRGQDRWHVSISALPLTLAFANHTEAEGAATMAKGMRDASLEKYRIQIARISCTADALERVARSEVSLKEIWKRAP